MSELKYLESTESEITRILDKTNYAFHWIIKHLYYPLDVKKEMNKEIWFCYFCQDYHSLENPPNSCGFRIEEAEKDG